MKREPEPRERVCTKVVSLLHPLMTAVARRCGIDVAAHIPMMAISVTLIMFMAADTGEAGVRARVRVALRTLRPPAAVLSRVDLEILSVVIKR
jgi:hypothetical protein